MSTNGNTVHASGISPNVTHSHGMQCYLDTVTYTSPEFDELETVIEICEPIQPAVQESAGFESKSQEPVPGWDVCVSPEFGEIETLI